MTPPRKRARVSDAGDASVTKEIEASLVCGVCMDLYDRPCAYVVLLTQTGAMRPRVLRTVPRHLVRGGARRPERAECLT